MTTNSGTFERSNTAAVGSWSRKTMRPHIPVLPPEICDYMIHFATMVLTFGLSEHRTRRSLPVHFALTCRSCRARAGLNLYQQICIISRSSQKPSSRNSTLQRGIAWMIGLDRLLTTSTFTALQSVKIFELQPQ